MTEEKITDLTPVEDSSMALAELDAELKEESRAIATALAGAPIIRTQGARFKMPDGNIIEGPVDFIIVGARREKQLWAKKFDDVPIGEVNGMVCAAVSGPDLDQYGMEPREGAPMSPSDDCDPCVENQWGKDPKTGKRVKLGGCKDVLSLAVMVPDLSDEAIYIINMSATGIKEGTAVLQEIKIKAGHPVKGVVTFKHVPTPRGAQRVGVKFKGINPNWPQHAQFRNRAIEILEATPRWYTEDSEVPTRESEPVKEHAAPKSSGRKARSAAS